VGFSDRSFDASVFAVSESRPGGRRTRHAARAALLLTSLLPLSAIAAEPSAPEATPETAVAGNPEGSETAVASAADDAAPAAPDPGVADSAQIETVLVRTRNRLEQQQDVPVPISVLSGKDLERDLAVNLSDFARRATNVQAAELNSRRSSLSIRGVGKNVNGEEFEAPVGVIIDNVFQPYVGSSWTNFSDIESIEIARGPQGTLLGKNTTLGVLNITSRRPSFTPSYSLDTSYGSRESGKISGSATGGVIDGLLAYRASFFLDTGDGSIENINENRSTWYDRNRAGGRLQFLLTPTEDLSARIIVQRSRARENINMNPPVEDPATFLDGSPRPITMSSRYARDWFGGGYTPLLQKFKVDVDYVTPSIDEQNSASAEVNWTLGRFELTSISAYMDNRFIPDNDFDWGPFDILRGGGARTDQQALSEELRLSSTFGESIDYQIGAYALRNRFNDELRYYYGEDAGAFYANDAQYAALNADAAGRELMRLALDNVGTSQINHPLTKSYALFGQANWHLTERATLTAGVRQTWEKKSNTWEFVLLKPGADLAATATANGASAAQLAAAQAIRGGPGGTGTGLVGSTAKFGPQRHAQDASTATSALLSPSYKLSDDVLLYLSLARGVKSGAVSWNSSDGSVNITDPEIALDSELGIKSTLFDRKLLLDVNLYRTDIKDFQTNQVVDTQGLDVARTIIGNARKVTLTGVELDGAWVPVRSFTLRFGGAYNIAEYDSYRDAPCPSDLSPTPPTTCDFSGRQLPGAPKFSANLGAEYRAPVRQRAVFHLSVNDAYTSRQNSSLGLSAYGWQGARHLIDANIGIATIDEKYDLSLLAKNLLDKVYSVDTSGFTPTGGVLQHWGERRYVGVTLRARF
jgi:iron complex outermembrane receptor protein